MTNEANAKPISFALNGKDVTASVDPARSLLSVLREELGVTSPKNGCEPQGACGCCTVLVDGRPWLACKTSMTKVAGHHVTTLEGLSERERRQLADCFVRSGGLQCGFCIPGIAVRATALLNRNPTPSRAEIVRELRAHLCRCTGYTKIIDAVELLARVRQGAELPSLEQSGKVGTRLDRHGARDQVLGDFQYVDDIRPQGVLYAGLRFADHPRAVVKAIDASAAQACAGVRRVITAADVPGERYVGLIERDWPVLVAIGEETRCMGDVIAIVIADNQRLARAAAAKLVVEYDVREPVTTPEAALKQDAPRIHPCGNLLSHSKVRRGTTESALADCAHVVEETYTTQRVEHMFLEPEACVAVPQSDGSRLHVFSQGQGVFDDRRQIAAVLGWEAERVHVELRSTGGAFGGKEDLSIQAQTALGAVLCAAPVKCTLTRAESFRLHPKRHPIRIHIKVGCDAEGHITGVWARMIGDKGAYASVGAKVIERAAGHAVGPYKVPNVDVEALGVYTNNPPGGAMRGFGVNQAAFAMERSLDRLAGKVGISGWEMRWRNVLDVGDRFCTGEILDKPFGLKRTLLAVKDAYNAAKYAGIACGIKNIGMGNGLVDEGKAVMRVESPRRITIRTGFTEMGQGYFTVCVQAACEETGLPPDVFAPLTDTSADVNCGQTTSSRATVLGGMAVKRAATALRAQLDAGNSLEDLVGREFRGEYTCAPTSPPDATDPEPRVHLTYGYATQVVILNDDGSMRKVIAAHDVGRVINPTLLEGQIEGAIHMGLGYALTEELVVQRGELQSRTVRSLNILRAHHMPEVECVFIEVQDPETVYGARGAGEIGLVPTAPAVAAALEAYDGIHRTSLPMRDSPAARAILKSKGPRRLKSESECK